MSETTTARRYSPSAVTGLPLRRKLGEGVRLFQLYRREARSNLTFDGLFAEIAEYDELLRRYADTTLDRARVFEIGFGARPHRQVALQSMGIDVRGVDVEAPVVPGRPSQFVRMYERNGVERAAKSLVRHTLFDRGEQRRLDAALQARGLARRIDERRLIVADAADLTLPAASVDLVISEDVFEHVPPEPLGRIVDRMAAWLRPGGLALVRPNVFTGITGGHLIGWSRRSLITPPPSREGEPWEHLRERRHAANTYLNELTRADYRALFGKRFEILEERVADPDLGREHFDARAQAALRDWPEEELFSNQTLFVLRPLAG